MGMKPLKCQECEGIKEELPFLYKYLNPDNFSDYEERKTCKDCWEKLNGLLRVISYGPMIKRNKKKHHLLTVVGKPIKQQMELF